MLIINYRPTENAWALGDDNIQEWVESAIANAKVYDEYIVYCASSAIFEHLRIAIYTGEIARTDVVVVYDEMGFQFGRHEPELLDIEHETPLYSYANLCEYVLHHPYDIGQKAWSDAMEDYELAKETTHA